jgi:hypothetical protein
MTDVNATEPTPVVVQQQNFDTELLAPAINSVISESKAGYKTTEFWVSVVVALLTVLDGIPLPEKFEGGVVTLIAVAYALSRGLAKQGVPAIEPQPDADAPTA